MLGLAFYGLDSAFLDGAIPSKNQRVVITDADLKKLAAGFQSQAGTRPTQQQLDQLIEKKIQDKILIQQALTLGLHQQDPVVQQRLAMNRTFLNQGEARGKDQNLINTMVQDDVVIQRRLRERMQSLLLANYQVEHRHVESFYQENKQKYQSDTRYLIDHKFIPKGQSEARSFINSHVALSTRNLESLLPDLLVEKVVSRNRPGALAPFDVTNGVHYVELKAVLPGKRIPLEQIEARVYSDFQQWLSKRLQRAFVDSLRSNYDVVVSAAGRRL